MSGKKRILVVDDAATVREQVVEYLGAEFDCEQAVDGVEALAAARRRPPDAVISDLEMPGMDGVELLRQLRAEPLTQRIPVIVATTSTAVDRVNECRALGCAGFVLKPVQREYLTAKLRQILSRAAAR